MNIKPIKTEADYESALKEIETLFGAEAETPKGDQIYSLHWLRHTKTSATQFPCQTQSKRFTITWRHAN